MSLAWSAYRLLTPLLGAAAPMARPFVPARERPLWGERLGRVRAAGGVEAWVHAASLGEALAVGPLVAALAAAAPAARFHLSATTAAGRARLAELGRPHSLAPLDTPQAVAGFLNGLRPRRLFLIETELWPHWMLGARAAGIPVAVVSARLSARSVARYRRLGGHFRALVGGLGGVLCQSEGDAARWRALGAPPGRTVEVGNLKDDALPGPAPDRARARADLALDPERPLLVLGSLRPGEAGMLATAWARLPEGLRHRWQVVAVPRHPRSATGLKAEATRAGQPPADGGPATGGAWRWDERLGVLAGYYAAADVAVVGGSFAPYGGHNPLEPAARGAAVIVGPHHAAQAGAVAALAAAGGARVARDPAELTVALAATLGDPATRQAAGDAALATVAARRGAAARAVERLAAWALWPAG